MTDKAPQGSSITPLHLTFVHFDKKSRLIQIIDREDGRVLKVQGSPKSLKDEEFLIQDVEGYGHVMVEKGIDPEVIRAMNLKSWPYLETTAEIICELVSQGETLSILSEKFDLPPYGILARWRREHPEFEEKLREAYGARAETYHAEALEQAFAAHEDDVQSRKLKVETCKWAAGVDNPERFGARTKLVGDANAPLSLILDTGIRRPGDPGFRVENQASKSLNGSAVPLGDVPGSLPKGDS